MSNGGRAVQPKTCDHNRLIDTSCNEPTVVIMTNTGVKFLPRILRIAGSGLPSLQLSNPETRRRKARDSMWQSCETASSWSCTPS
jgi:hypothetical protein